MGAGLAWKIWQAGYRNPDRKRRELMSDKLIVAAIQMDCVTNDRKANLARAEALVGSEDE